jgi:UDP-N-acetyl-D-galactosamine dehydrogenase
LVEKASMLGIGMPLISASRALNDSMGCYIADQVSEALGSKAQGAKVLVLGLTFKENIPDMRNSKVIDVIKHLNAKGCTVHVHDAQVGQEDVTKMALSWGSLNDGPFDAVLLLVPHREYLALQPEEFQNALKPKGVFFDLKSLMDARAFKAAGFTYLSL